MRTPYESYVPAGASDLLYPLHLPSVARAPLPSPGIGAAMERSTSSRSPMPPGAALAQPRSTRSVPLSADPAIASAELFRRLNGTFRLRRRLHHPIVHDDVTFTEKDLLYPSDGRSTIGHGPYTPQVSRSVQEVFEQTSVIEYKPLDGFTYADFEITDRKAFTLMKNGLWEVWHPTHPMIGGDGPPKTAWDKAVRLQIDEDTLKRYRRGETHYVWLRTVHGDGELKGSGDRMRIAWAVTPHTEMFEIRHWTTTARGKNMTESMDELYRVS